MLKLLEKPRNWAGKPDIKRGVCGGSRGSSSSDHHGNAEVEKQCAHRGIVRTSGRLSYFNRKKDLKRLTT